MHENNQRHTPLKKMAACLAALGILLASYSNAAEPQPQTSEPLQTAQLMQIAVPYRAVISPHGGRLEVRQTVPVQEMQGMRIISFVIPQDAQNLQISIPGETIIRWAATPVLGKSSSAASNYRDHILNDQDTLTAILETIKTRIAVWKEQTAPASPQELERRQGMMQEELPTLVKRQEQIERELNDIKREIAHIPGFDRLKQKITVTLAPESSASGNLEIAYSYNLVNCGWDALYDFDAATDKPDQTGIKVRFLAEVWQNTGIDWKGTEIILASMGNGPREPAPLPRWVVGENQPSPMPKPRVYNLQAKAAMPAAATMEDAAPVEEMARVTGNTGGIYATWQLSARGLPDGKSRVQILTDTWHTRLEWLSRPTIHDNRVWIMAKYDLPPEQAWPAGAAIFSLNGQNVGQGSFVPTGREITLYFGADPRVTVATAINASQQGETGFINTSKTWTGAWTYTVNNEHDSEIGVRVERPAPMITSEQIKVSYRDNPPSTLDEQKHMLYWDVAVPAHGKTDIKHEIVISSPEKLPIFPTIN